MSEVSEQPVAASSTDAPEVVRIELPTHYPIGPVNVFLVKDDPLTLIDAGLNNDESWVLVEQGVRDAGCELRDIGRVLLTHGHTDHVGLLPRLLEIVDAEVYAHVYAAERLRNPEKGEADGTAFVLGTLQHCGVPDAAIEQVREVRAQFRDLRVSVPAARDLHDGDAIGRYEVRHVPGHSPADVLFIDWAARSAFTGDHIIPLATPVAFLRPAEAGEPRPRTLVEFIASLERTRELDLDICNSGHGESLHDHREAIDTVLRKLERRTNRARAILKDGECTPYEVCSRMFGAAKEMFLHMLVAAALGHLDVLEARGEAVSEERDGVLYFRLVNGER